MSYENWSEFVAWGMPEIDEVHLWHVAAREVAGVVATDYLTEAEMARKARLHKHADQQLFLTSRVLLRSVLGDILGVSPRDVSLAASATGKPMIADHPVRFNLTHSGDYALLAVSRDREVGVDIENTSRGADYRGMAQRWFAPDEARHIAELADNDIAPAFFAVWTLKEAFVKALGLGLSYPLDAFCFDLTGATLRQFRPLAADLDGDWWFHQFKVDANHAGALAVRGGPARVVQRAW